MVSYIMTNMLLAWMHYRIDFMSELHDRSLQKVQGNWSRRVVTAIITVLNYEISILDELIIDVDLKCDTCRILPLSYAIQEAR